MMMSEQLTVAAKPGEVWAFSIEGEEQIVGFAVVADVWGRIEFRTVLGNVLKLPTTVYTGARRIWPEQESERSYEYRWVARFDNGEEWDSQIMNSRGEALSFANHSQAKEDEFQATDDEPDMRVTFSAERRIVVTPTEWESIDKDGA